MRDEQLTVTLSDEQADFVREQVERRGAGSADDVVADALGLLRKREADLARIRAEIQAARDDPRPHLSDEQLDERLQALRERKRVQSA